MTENNSPLPEKPIEKLDHHPEMAIDNLPNRLTIFRILLIPFVVGPLLLINTHQFTSAHHFFGWLAAFAFGAASITDFLDGYIARKRGLVTVFGSFLDPVADKFLVVSSLIMLQALGRVPTVLVIILVLRELYMTSLRLLATSEGINVPVNKMGKWKTTTQMIGIPLLMTPDRWLQIPFGAIGIISIYIAAFLSVYSAVVYSAKLLKKLKVKRMQKKASTDINH